MPFCLWDLHQLEMQWWKYVRDGVFAWLAMCKSHKTWPHLWLVTFIKWHCFEIQIPKKKNSNHRQDIYKHMYTRPSNSMCHGLLKSNGNVPNKTLNCHSIIYYTFTLYMPNSPIIHITLIPPLANVACNCLN